MSRHNTLESAFLFENFRIGDQKIHPLSANRRTFLRKMGNGVVGDGAVGEDDLSQALFSCTMTGSELGAYLTNPAKFKDDATSFAVKLPDYTLEKFQTEIEAEAERLRLAQVEAVEGKPQDATQP